MAVTEPNIYLEKVRLKRKKNQERIEALGLANISRRQQRSHSIRTPVQKKRAISPSRSTPPRRSARVSKDPVKFEALDARSDYDKLLLQKRIEIRSKEGNKSRRSSLKKRKFDLGKQISASQRKLLKSLPMEDWVEDMEHYFLVEEGNSKSNVQRVISVVRKLVEGDGVRHPQTQEFFLRNSTIHLGMDFRKMLDDASEWVYSNGGDRGHGWMIEHPVKKIWVYQQARSQRGSPFSA